MQDSDIDVKNSQEGYYVELGAGNSASVAGNGGFAEIGEFGNLITVTDGDLTKLRTFGRGFSLAFK